MRGCLLELLEYSGDDLQKQEQYKRIKALKPYKMVLLREIDDEQYLVTICKETNKPNYVRFSTINGDVYVNIRSFQSVDRSFCSISKDAFQRPYLVLKEIYAIHNSWLQDLNNRNRMRRKNIKQKREKMVLESYTNIKRANHGKSFKDIPPHLQWAAKHPYQGGGFSGK